VEDKDNNELDKPRARYVWDRDKLAWVEAAEQPIRDDLPVEIAREEHLEEAPAEIREFETVAETEGLQYRGAWIRLAAFILDFIILLIITFIVQKIIGSESVVSTYVMPIIGVGFFVGFWTWRGQTPGKMAVGAKVVKVDGSPVSIWRAFFRYIGYSIYLFASTLGVNYGGWFVPVIIFIFAFLLIALSREKRGLHDRIAGTVVINTRPKPLEDYEDEEVYVEAYGAEEEDEVSE